ncbi:MAG: hypothetical protein RR293_08545 [Bacteroidales bacterium]
MTSIYARLYLALQQRLNSVVREIKWIEQDFGQESMSMRPGVAFPAALIDFPDTIYSAMMTEGQLGIVTISIRLLVAPFSQSYEGAPINVKKDALKYFEIEKQLSDALHGWMPAEGYCQPLTRVAARGENRGEIGLRIRTLTFETSFEEY